MFHKTDMQRSTVVWWKNHTGSGKLCPNPQPANPCVPCFETDIEIAWPQDQLFWFCYPHCRVVRFTSNTRPVSGGGRHLVQCRHQRVCWWPAAGQIVSSKSWDMGPQMEGRFLEANYPCSTSFHQLQDDHPIRKGVLHMAAARHVLSAAIIPCVLNRESMNWRTLVSTVPTCPLEMSIKNGTIIPHETYCRWI